MSSVLQSIKSQLAPHQASLLVGIVLVTAGGAHNWLATASYWGTTVPGGLVIVAGLVLQGIYWYVEWKPEMPPLEEIDHE